MTLMGGTVAASPTGPVVADDEACSNQLAAITCTYCAGPGSTNCVCVSTEFGCIDSGYQVGCTIGIGPDPQHMTGHICEPWASS